MKPILFATSGICIAALLWLFGSFAQLPFSYGLSLYEVDSYKSGLHEAETAVLYRVQSAEATEEGYSLVPIAGGLADPIALAFLPNGDALIAERGSGTDASGRSHLRMIRNRALLPTPTLTLSTNVAGTSGIHGLALDPKVAENGYIYVYYARGANALNASGPTKNRLSRFTLNIETGLVDSTSELIVLDELRWSPYNNGGALRFGADGTLYLGIGDTEQPQHARKLDRYPGKVLRIRPTTTGYSLPPDNPFLNEGEAHPELFAYGFRNPVAFAHSANQSNLYVADQGESMHEEVDVIRAGGHYGWPTREGFCLRGQNEPDACLADARYVDPVADYPHGTFGSSVRGLMVVDSPRYPAELQGSLLFVDSVSNFVGTFDLATQSRDKLVVNTGSLRGLAAHDGYLYTLNGTTGELMLLYYDLERVSGVGTMQPTVSLSVDPPLGIPPASVTLSAIDSTDPKGLGLTYVWNFGDGSPERVSTSPVVTHTYTADGVFTATVQATDLLGDLSEAASDMLSLYGGALPEIVLENATEPGRERYYSGDRFTFRVERESGVSGLSESTPYRWRIDLHHRDLAGEHVHPLSNFSEAEGLLRLRLTDEHNDGAEIFYRFHLTMTTEEGLEIPTFRDLAPELSTLAIGSQPGAATIAVNSSPFTAPYTRTIIAGQALSLTAAPTIFSNGGIGEFAYWHLYQTEWPLPLAVVNVAASGDGGSPWEAQDPGDSNAASLVPPLLNETIIYSRTATIDASHLNTSIVAHYEYAQPAETTYLPFLSGR